MYKSLIRPILFRFDPEKIHHFTFNTVHALSKVPGFKPLCRALYKVEGPGLKRTFFGIDFPNPVGLAAGFDKDARLIDELAAFGFGFIEIGTLTPKGQPGNDKPRLFRLPEDKAIINRMGFNNEGVVDAVKRLKKRKSKVIVGGNIGKNKMTPIDDAEQDYIASFKALYNYVDYFVVNVSSPNTPNLRALQDKEPLMALLARVQEVNDAMPKKKPLLLKIAPDLTNSQLDDIVQIAGETKLDGLIATNTTISREGLQTAENRLASIGAGGLSGAPVKEKSDEIVRYLRAKMGPDFPIIGVGGIMSAQDARDKLKAGASLVQVYTGFIYEGPGLVRDINQSLMDEHLHN